MEKVSTLPPMEFKFSIQMVGSESGLNWTGKFLYKRPSLGERSRINVMQTRLNGDLETLEQDVLQFNEAISHLRYTLRDFPEWWKESGFGIELYDGNVVSEIYNKCLEYEAKWMKRTFGGEKAEVDDVDTDGDEDLGAIGHEGSTNEPAVQL